MYATRRLWMTPLLIVLSSTGLAQETDLPQPWRSWEFLVGEWELVEENYDSDGQLLQTHHGSASFEFLSGPRCFQERQALQREDEMVDALQLMVYDSQAGKVEIVRTDSGHFGFWLIEGTLGAESIVLRESHPNPESAVLRRITYQKDSLDRFARQLEFSRDEGKSWFVRSVWNYRRR